MPMTEKPPFTKIFDGVAARKQMFELFNRISDCPFEDRISGKAYENTWFEVDREGYETMLEVLPPLFMRAGMFALSVPRAGFAGSVFFDLDIIDGRDSWFPGHFTLAESRDSVMAL